MKRLLEPTLIVRYEGCFADDSVRKGLLLRYKISLKDYFDSFHLDLPNKKIIDLLSRYRLTHNIIIYSNHPEQYAHNLREFIIHHSDLDDNLFELHCSKKNDKRPFHKILENLIIAKSNSCAFEFGIDWAINCARVLRDHKIYTFHSEEYTP